MKKYIPIVAGVSLSLALLLSAVFYITGSEEFYLSEFDKHNVYSRTDLTKEEVHEAGRGMIAYLKNEEESFQLTLNGKLVYSQRELDHMEDVLNIFNSLRSVRNLSLSLGLLLLVYQLSWKNIFRAGRALGITALVLGIGVAFVGMSFSENFVRFHEVVFTNDKWLLSLQKHRLIQMLPEGFFLDAFIAIGVTYVSLAITIMVLSWWNLWRMKKKEE